jgi:hypothetical protein
MTAEASLVEVMIWAPNDALPVSSPESSPTHALSSPFLLSTTSPAPRSLPLDPPTAVLLSVRGDTRLSRLLCIDAKGYHEPDVREKPFPDLPYDCSPSVSHPGGSSGRKQGPCGGSKSRTGEIKIASHFGTPTARSRCSLAASPG